MGSLVFEHFITSFLFPALTPYHNELRMNVYNRNTQYFRCSI